MYNVTQTRVRATNVAEENKKKKILYILRVCLKP